MSIAILINGAPTAGKETQSEIVQQELGARYVITSKALDEDGHREKMIKGDLVSDDIVFESIMKRVDSNMHLILDGSTRSPQQAKSIPLKLRAAGFDIVVSFELNLTDVQVAMDRRNQRLENGGSAERPDGDIKQTFLKRFENHNEQADSIRKILIRECDEFFIIDACKSKEDIAKRIKDLIKIILEDTYPEDFVDTGGFLGQSEHYKP